MYRRFLVIMMVLLLAAVSFSMVSAQSGAQVFCGDLAEADCNLLIQSQETMAEIESVTFSFGGDLAVTGLEKEAGVDPLVINATGDGALAVDVEAMAALEAASGGDMTQTMENLPQLMADLFNAFQAKMQFKIDVPEQLMTPDMPNLSFDLIMVDGVIYLDTAPLMNMAQPSWMGIDLAGMYKTLMDMGTTGGTGGMDLSSIGSLDIFANLNNPDYVGRYMTITRLADAEVSGQTVAVFETIWDYGTVFSDEQFRADFDEYMAAVMEMQGMSPDTLGKEYDAMMKTLYSLLADWQISMVQWIGLDDQFLHHSEFHMTLNLDLAQLAALDPSTSSQDIPESVGITIDASLDLSAFNEPVEVVAPEGAQVINPAMYMGGQF